MKANNIKATQVTRGLIEYLKKTKQLGILPALVSETLKKSQTENDPSTAQVTTAIRLGNAEVAQIQKLLKNILKRDMKIKNIVDTNVIAGMRIKIGDKVIDNTIESKINKLSERLAQ